MTFEQLCEQTAERPQDLGRWMALGLISDKGSFDAADAEQVRLIRFALDRGYSPEVLAEMADRHGDVIGPFVGSVGVPIHERSYSLEEAAAKIGFDGGLFARLWAAAGLGDQPRAFDEDIEAFSLLKLVLAGGIPEEVVLQLARVFADAQGKIADAITRLFHLYVHDQQRSAGAGGAELLEETNAISEPLVGVIEPFILFFHRKAWAKALREDMMLHLAEETTAPGAVPGQFERAILFVDLSSFTPLTETMGDAAAAQVVQRFSDLVRDAVTTRQGQVVKQIGDEFMLVFADGAAAVRCGMAIREAARSEPRFPGLRIGAHAGSVLYREGDYVGINVNVAARVTSAAKRNQFLVTDAVRAQIGDLDVEVVDVGARPLKGLSEPVVLFEVRGPADDPERVVDPVCGMELDEGSSEAELSWLGKRLLFCSEACLRRFLDGPERYEVS